VVRRHRRHAKHLVVTNAADDSLDWTFGWSGRMQFAVVSQRGDDADAGIEADNNEFNNELLPRSNPTIFNVTSAATPTATRAARAQRGLLLLRRGTAGNHPQLHRSRASRTSASR
jgi:hypothetical protein